MQGGLLPPPNHPSGAGVEFDWYLDLLRFIKREYPSIHIHAFSPPEIWAFHKNFDIPLLNVIQRLIDAGLDTIPGGGGEILVERVRQKIGRGKCNTEQWLEVMRQAHRLGMKTSCTMMFGHVETVFRTHRTFPPSARPARRNRRLYGVHPLALSARRDAAGTLETAPDRR